MNIIMFNRFDDSTESSEWIHSEKQAKLNENFSSFWVWCELKVLKLTISGQLLRFTAFTQQSNQGKCCLIVNLSFIQTVDLEMNTIRFGWRKAQVDQ